VPVSWKVVITFLSSIIGLIPNRTFWNVSLLNSVSRYVIIVRTDSITTKDLYLTFQGTQKCIIYVTYRMCINHTDADLNRN